MPRFSIKDHMLDFLAFLSTTRFVPAFPESEEWWRSNIKSVKCPVPLRCTICDHVVHPLIDNFWRQPKKSCHGSASCRCGYGNWASESSRIDLLKKIETTKFRPVGFLVDSNMYRAEAVNAHTKIPLVCSECGVHVDSCQLQSFWKCLSAKCACNLATQTTVRDLVIDTVNKKAPGCFDVLMEMPLNTRSDVGGVMRYDISIVRRDSASAILFIEVDGKQHFVRETAFSKGFDQRVKNDVQKELYAIGQSVPMIRIYQMSFWNTRILREFDATAYIKDLVEKAIDSKLECKVHRQPGEPLYCSGVYASLRVGTAVEV